MLLIVLSEIFNRIMFTGAFERRGVSIVFSGHQFINKCVAPFYYFGNFLDLSLFDLFIKDFFVFSII